MSQFRQKPLRFAPIARPVDRVSVKAAKYEAQSTLAAAGADLLGKWIESTKKDERKKPEMYDRVIEGVNQNFDAMDLGDRMAKGAYARTLRQSTYAAFKKERPDTDITEDQYDKAIKFALKFGKLPSGKKMLASDWTNMVKSGDFKKQTLDFDDRTGELLKTDNPFVGFKEHYEQRGIDVSKYFSREEIDRMDRSGRVRAFRSVVESRFAKLGPRAIPTINRFIKHQIQKKNLSQTDGTKLKAVAQKMYISKLKEQELRHKVKAAQEVRNFNNELARAGMTARMANQAAGSANPAIRRRAGELSMGYAVRITKAARAGQANLLNVKRLVMGLRDFNPRSQMVAQRLVQDTEDHIIGSVISPRALGADGKAKSVEGVARTPYELATLSSMYQVAGRKQKLDPENTVRNLSVTREIYGATVQQEFARIAPVLDGMGVPPLRAAQALAGDESALHNVRASLGNLRPGDLNLRAEDLDYIRGVLGMKEIPKPPAKAKEGVVTRIKNWFVRKFSGGKKDE